MDENSLEAYHAGKWEIFGACELEVLRALRTLGKATDREIMDWLEAGDMNRVRPRITNLLNLGVLEKTGNTRCPVTNRTVRVCRIVPTQSGQLFLFHGETQNQHAHAS